MARGDPAGSSANLGINLPQNLRDLADERYHEGRFKVLADPQWLGNFQLMADVELLHEAAEELADFLNYADEARRREWAEWEREQLQLAEDLIVLAYRHLLTVARNRRHQR